MSTETEAELSAELSALFERARAAGVRVRGGWTCPSEEGPDLDVVVTEVAADSRGRDR